MNGVKEHFEEEAEAFDELIMKIIPFYINMVDSLALTLPFDKNERIEVLDLGCGTGNISKAVKEMFPKACITCVDLAENMINMSKAKLAQYEDIKFLNTDFIKLKYEDEFDAVVSSLALHHLQPQVLRRFYHKICDFLHSGGVFSNAEIIKAPNSQLRHVYRENWIDHMLRSFSWKEVEEVWIPRHEAEDFPVPLQDHLEWLKEAGFREVDVLWKYYYFGVYCGTK